MEKIAAGLELEDVANKVKGEEGTTVNIEIKRDEETFSIDVERRKVEIKYMDSEVLEGNIGYIRLVSFDEGCTEKVKEEIENFKKQNIKSLILDLRDNGGGLVTEAISLSEIFVPNGKIIFKSYNKSGDEQIVKSKSLKTENIELIVLVNEESASATEIFSGAIKDNGIGKIIGTKTYGKGVMQEVDPLIIGGALKITIEEFKTPNGDTINKNGITPDIEIEEDYETDEDEQLNCAINEIKK